MKKEIKYMLYDGRYLSDNEDSVCYEICDTLQEAKRNYKDYGDDTFIVEATMASNGAIINTKIIHFKKRN